MSEDIDTYTQQNDRIKARREALKEKMDELSSYRKRKPLSESNADSSTKLSGGKRRQRSAACDEENTSNGKCHIAEVDFRSEISSNHSESTDRADVFPEVDQKENFVLEASTATNTKPVHLRGKSKFAALAATIHQWESEDIQALPSYKSKFNSEPPNTSAPKYSPIKKIPRVSARNEDVHMKPSENSLLTRLDDNQTAVPKPVITGSIKKEPEIVNVNVKNKVSIWDKAVVATLEAQGFTKSPSASKITYQYPSPASKSKTQDSNNTIRPKVSSAEATKKAAGGPAVPVAKQLSFGKEIEKQPSCEHKVETEVSVSDRVSMFSQAKKRRSDVVDPATMSLSARVALFEKAMDKPQQPSTASILFKKSSVSEVSEVNNQPAPQPSLSLPLCQSPKKPDKTPMSPSKASASNLTKHVHQNLMNQVSDKWQSNDIASKLKAEREQELVDLRNRWEKKPKGNEVNQEDSQSDSDEDYMEHGTPEEEDDLPPEEEYNQPEKGYGSPDHVNCGNSQLENSFLRSIVEEEEEYSGDVDDDVAEACGEIDKMLEEAMEDDACRTKANESDIVTKPGHLYPSLDFAKPSEPVSSLTPPPPINVLNEEGTELPLMHTVSFYRRQKDIRTTPVKKLVRKEVLSPPSPTEEHNKKQTSILQKIKYLQEKINEQQTIISQTSQALNLCRATSEFYGSSEQIEGERLLLIATQKRQACLDEITRLKTEGAMMDVKQKMSYNECEGVLTIGGIRLPLKQAFVVAIAEGKHDNFVHNFLCLIRHGSQVIATEMISTQQGTLSSGSLSFSNMITIHDLESDFNVIFEVYGLQCPKESMPHDRKYHIKKESSKLKLTPTKKKEMKKIIPAISSPGGPLAIRTSSFAIIGYTKLSLKNLTRQVFVLEKVPATSPLEGNVYMKVTCHADLRADQRGFLTMFEDVSGFGAWHRRWCVLTGQHLAYWKYPNDEKKKEPIGFIDLRRCITRDVTSAPREICARLNTLMMVTMKPLTDGVEENLITQKYDTVTTTKHLLSADSKEERVWWCDKINQALSNVRKWDPQALRPVDLNRKSSNT